MTIFMERDMTKHPPLRLPVANEDPCAHGERSGRAPRRRAPFHDVIARPQQSGRGDLVANDRNRVAERSGASRSPLAMTAWSVCSFESKQAPRNDTLPGALFLESAAPRSMDAFTRVTL